MSSADSNSTRKWGRFGAWAAYGGVPFIAFIVGAANAPRLPGLVYFEIAAEVIPLLFLVLAVEAGFFRLRDIRDVPQLHYSGPQGNGVILMLLVFPRWFLLVALVAGELTAIDAVATGRADIEDAQTVAGSLTAGVVGVALFSAFGAMRLRGRREPMESEQDSR